MSVGAGWGRITGPSFYSYFGFLLKGEVFLFYFFKGEAGTVVRHKCRGEIAALILSCKFQRVASKYK